MLTLSGPDPRSIASAIGITASGPDKGDPWFHKSYAEMEAEAEKLVKEFMDRNS